MYRAAQPAPTAAAAAAAARGGSVMLWGGRGGGRGGRAKRSIFVLLSVFLREDAKGDTAEDKHGTRIIKLITRPSAREETRPTTRYRHAQMHSTVRTLSGPFISKTIHHQRDHLTARVEAHREREREREREKERERERPHQEHGDKWGFSVTLKCSTHGVSWESEGGRL